MYTQMFANPFVNAPYTFEMAIKNRHNMTTVSGDDMILTEHYEIKSL